MSYMARTGLGQMSLKSHLFEKISLFLKFCSHTS